MQDGVVPADSPDAFIVPRPVDSQGKPLWFGPAYQATPETLAEFTKPEGSEPDAEDQLDLFGD